MQDSIWSNEDFRSAMDVISSRLSIDILAIPNFTVLYGVIDTDIRVNENILFRWGSALAFSNCQDERASALKIAHFLLLSNDLGEEYKELGYTLLKRLKNRNSAELALERGLLKSEPEQGFFSILSQSRVDFESQFELNGKLFYLNSFQGELLTAIKNHTQIAVSAPTSAGKSFIVERWIAQSFLDGCEKDLALIVPTRALIHQMEMDMRRILKHNDLKDVQIVTVPNESFITEDKKNLFIFTQERFHIYLNLVNKKRGLSALIVDEAQKVSDGSRGVLLQQVIESAVRQNDELKLIFLTPSSKNPEALLVKGHGREAVVDSSEVTVGQNLFWLVQMPRNPARWSISIVLKSGRNELGHFQLSNKPSSVLKRLSFVSFHIGGVDPGNIVYVNGAADAEKVAWQLSQLIENKGFEADEELNELVEFVGETIHPKYMLVNTLQYGVAFHYGNMPLLVKSEIERLFGIGKICYLVCTSTLVEGVNTACRNLFVRGPKRGRLNKMNALDFWNLAGRAGRWGKEFEGNIFCIDTDKETLWENGRAPSVKEKFEIKSAVNISLSKGEELLGYLNNAELTSESRSNKDAESTVNYLFSKFTISANQEEFLSSLDSKSEWINEIGRSIEKMSGELKITDDVINRNPGINPRYMDVLLAYFYDRGHDPELYLPPDPNSKDAVTELTKVFARTYKCLGSNLGPASRGRSFALSMLVVNWMRGFTLRRIIDSQVKYDSKMHANRNLATTIRNVLNEIEQYARYQAPKYIACYADVLNHYYIEIGREDLCRDLEDFSLYLEFGASQITQISLISLGLSRSTAITLSEYLVSDIMSQEQALTALRKIDVESIGLSIIVRKEISEILS